MRFRLLIAISIGISYLAACTAPAAESPPVTPHSMSPTPLVDQSAHRSGGTLEPEFTATPQETATPIHFDPSAAGSQAGVNPLTGLAVQDPDLLKVPAVLVSVSHFPATGRPQAGLSFAPFVYEFSITGGETRFLAVFHGEFPRPESPIRGDCPVRTGAFKETDLVIGNEVWLDANRNGARDVDEEGIPGICVLLRSSQGTILQTTTTDTNGRFGFDVKAGAAYHIDFLQPTYLAFTMPDIGLEDLDSDADPHTGETAEFVATHHDLSWDAGMIPNGAQLPEAPASGAMPKPEVGPVRSGRLLYAYLAASYTDSCLIYAFASPEVLAKLPHCAFVSHEDANGGEMLSIDRMQKVAEDNMRHTANRAFDYASNAYSDAPPVGGAPGTQLRVFFGNLNQSGWTYDPLYGGYLRYVDNADVNAMGVLHPDVDRLTGRQLHIENVIVIMADTDVLSPTNLDIHVDAGNTGKAELFRDGRRYSILWSTRGGEYEKRTGLRRPIQFVDANGVPFALKPGHTWIIIVTPFSSFEPGDGGESVVKYAPPAGEAQ